jgi:hypothetical protein
MFLAKVASKKALTEVGSTVAKKNQGGSGAIFDKLVQEKISFFSCVMAVGVFAFGWKYIGIKPLEQLLSVGSGNLDLGIVDVSINETGGD